MKVIVVNGPMGVGKTAVGKAIADKVQDTAFIDGDWCMDIHPFVGNRETKAMAVDNILHMIGNYGKCSACGMVVLAWLMDSPWVLRDIVTGIAALDMEAVCVTLTCDEASLAERWRNDGACPWRTDAWLEASRASLPYFASMDNAIDTSGLSVDGVAERILKRLDCTFTN